MPQKAAVKSGAVGHAVGVKTMAVAYEAGVSQRCQLLTTATSNSSRVRRAGDGTDYILSGGGCNMDGRQPLSELSLSSGPSRLQDAASRGAYSRLDSRSGGTRAVCPRPLSAVQRQRAVVCLSARPQHMTTACKGQSIDGQRYGREVARRSG
jgi:hypothetical protein